MNACALMNLFICFGEPQAEKLRRNSPFTQTALKHKERGKKIKEKGQKQMKENVGNERETGAVHLGKVS